MPHIYQSEALADTARRGRRALRLSPNYQLYRNGLTDQLAWESYAINIIADILHGLNSRLSLSESHDDLTGESGPLSVLYQAARTYLSDLEEEREWSPEDGEGGAALGPLTQSDLV